MEFDWMIALKAGLAAVIGAFSAFWGWMGWLVAIWVFLMAVDYITGTAAAIKAGTWASKAAREGIWHKMGELVVVVVAALADRVLVVVIAQLPLIDIALPGTGLLLPMVLVLYHQSFRYVYLVQPLTLCLLLLTVLFDARRRRAAVGS